MIRKGTSRHACLILRDLRGETLVSGDREAFFGYTAGDGRRGDGEGVWARWKWDGESFGLCNDRFGFYPLYYFRDAGGFGVSDSLVELLRQGADPALDDEAIAVFLRLGFFLGDDTPFRAIRAVPPAARMRWSRRDGLRLESRHRIPAAPAGGAPSRAEAVRRFGELFESAVEALLPNPGERVVLPLSGGRDSRHILFALLRQGRRPDLCVTVRHLPPRPDEDARVASRLARALGLPHEILPQTGDRLRAELRKNVLTDFCADEHAWLLPLRERLRAWGCTIAYDGLAGAVISAGEYLHPSHLAHYEDGTLDALADHYLGPEDSLRLLLRPAWYRRWSRAAAVRRLARQMGEYRGCPNPVGQFYFWNRSRREIALSPWGILNDGCTVVAPFLSGELCDFLASLPASYFFDRAFHTEAIAARYPEHAQIPYETKASPPARPVAREVAVFAAGTARYCIRPFRTGAPRASHLLHALLRGVCTRRRGAGLFALGGKALYLEQLLRLAADPRAPV